MNRQRIRIEYAVSTHPDIAALVTPLSASRIEGISSLTSFRRRRSEGGTAERRPVVDTACLIMSPQGLSKWTLRGRNHQKWVYTVNPLLMVK